ncbi:hypothetical protein RJT34_31192 [Clitoria ternatea]|uniref:Protein RFT1 homolog n=1 Tax=Clitoria ternatea TaxID=43366 RepID=A0AAN9EVX9_CLITE
MLASTHNPQANTGESPPSTSPPGVSHFTLSTWCLPAVIHFKPTFSLLTTTKTTNFTVIHFKKAMDSLTSIFSDPLGSELRVKHRNTVKHGYRGLNCDLCIVSTQTRLEGRILTVTFTISSDRCRESASMEGVMKLMSFACILELLVEPLYILSQNLVMLKLRLMVETVATLHGP